MESRNKFPSAEVIDALALGISASQLFEEEGSPENAAAFDRERFTDEIVDGLHRLIQNDKFPAGGIPCGNSGEIQSGA